MNPVARALAVYKGIKSRRIDDSLGEPPWASPVEHLADQSVAAEWRTGVLNLANRRHRPSSLGKWMHGDRRLAYAIWFLDLRNATVLELGPLEGYFSVLLEKLGIARSVAVEAREENLTKCLHVQQLFGLDKTRFVQHDIERLVRRDEKPAFSGPFDLVFALGVLYHLRDPAAALRWMAEMAPALFLGTHYIERTDERRYPDRLFTEWSVPGDNGSYTGKLFADSPGSIAGGLVEESFWLDEDSLLRALKAAGYESIQVLGRDLVADFPHITILAEQNRA